jgi:hypothetical protein
MPGSAWRKERSEVMPRARKYPVELLDRATRLVFESGRVGFANSIAANSIA